MHQAPTDLFDGSDMSPRTAAAAIAARNRRTPHGKGRFDPSEPLHMTTRHAARNGRGNGTPSPDGSMDDEDSPQGSFNDMIGMSSQSLGSLNSTRGRRMSLTSANGASATNLSFDTQSSAGQNVLETRQPELSSPMVQSTSPSRKRKRSTPTPPESLHGIDNSLANSVADMMEQDPRDFVQVVHPDDLSDRESEASVESDEQFAVDYLGATQSTENTPAATPLGSQVVSPVSEESNPDVFFPAKPVSVAKVEATKPIEPDDVDDVEVEDAEELVEVDEVDDVEDVDDADDQARGPRRRLAGRRRAEHHDPKVEATMRRQLQLKSTFRAIARALKPVLAEIAHKTVETLEEDPNLHEQVVEYHGTEEEEGIQQMLDDALARRKAQLKAQYRWNKQNLQKTLQGEDKVLRSRYDLQVQDFRDSQLDRLEHDLLTVARTAHVVSDDVEYVTEDESEDPVPRPHAVDYRYTRSGPIDSEYDSRSRLALESETAVRDLQTRFEMFKMLKAVRPEDRPGGMRFFTTMDSTAREAASARKESIMSTHILAEAAAEKERRDQIPVVPNEQAIGLQILGEVAGQLGQAPDPPATPPPPPRVTPPAQMLPPPQNSRLPLSLEGPSHDMSPRATGFPDRQAQPVRPLASPRHPQPARERAPSQSPRKEPMNLSPMFQTDRGKTLPPFNMHPRDAEHTLRHESLPAPPPAPTLHETRDVFGRDRSHRDIFGREIIKPEAAAPPLLGAQVREEPAWDKYHRSLNVDRSPKPPPQPDRSIHEFSQGGPLRIERVETTEPRRQHVRGPSNSDPFMIGPALNGPVHKREPSFDRATDHAPTRPQSQEPRSFLSYTSPRMDPNIGRSPFLNARGPINSEPFVMDPALSRLPPYEGRELVRRHSPPVGPEFSRAPFREEQRPTHHDPAMIDPALSRPSQREERAPRHLQNMLIDPALNRPSQSLAPGTINQDSALIDPALTRPLLQEEYRPLRHASPTFQPTQAKAQSPWEAPSSPGAADSRERSEPSPMLAPRDAAVDHLSRKPRSRASSVVSQSTTTEASLDVSVAGESTTRRASGKQQFTMKPSRGDRKGGSRRSMTFKEHNPHQSRKSQASNKPEVYRFRLNSIESTPSTLWSSSSNRQTARTSNDIWTTQSTHGPVPTPSHAPSGHPLPPPPGVPPQGWPHDYMQSAQHRNSFPQSGMAWPPPTQQPPQSPLYAVSQSTQPTPPPSNHPQPGGGPPPDQWPSPSIFAPTLFRPTQTPRPNPQPAQPPQLAPAPPSVQRALASGEPTTNHLPAFAQQQRKEEANPRRRAHSEIQGHSFKHWAPRNIK